MTEAIFTSIPPLPATLPLPQDEVSSIEVQFDRSVAVDPVVLLHGGSDFDHHIPEALIDSIRDWMAALSAVGIVPTALHARIPASFLCNDQELPHITSRDVQSFIDQLRNMLRYSLDEHSTIWMRSNGQTVQNTLLMHGGLSEQAEILSDDIISSWALERRPWFAACLGRAIHQRGYSLRCQGYPGSLAIQIPLIAGG